MIDKLPVKYDIFRVIRDPSTKGAKLRAITRERDKEGAMMIAQNLKDKVSSCQFIVIDTNGKVIKEFM